MSQQNPMSPVLVIGALVGAYLLVGHLEHQDQVAEAQAYCQAKGPGWTYSDDTKGCWKRPLPECEPARQHKPTTTRNLPEYCNHATTK